MGLNIKPIYRIYANNNEITSKIAERLITLRFTDESGFESDILEITLSDHDWSNPIEMPPKGAELELFIGYDNTAQRMGMFVVDESEIGGWPGELTIRARAAQFDTSKAGKSYLQTQKSRAWPKNTKLGDMVKKIAADHSMSAKISDELASIVLPSISQTDESDLHLLVRICGRFDAIAKAAGGSLVVTKKGKGKTVSGGNMPSITITPFDNVTQFRVIESKRETAGEVIAYWHDVNSAKRHEVFVGDGEPKTRLKMQYPTKEMALAAARSELERKERGKQTGSLTVVGRPDLAAESRLTLSGFRPGVDGEWSITRVEHTLNNSGYICSVDFEQLNANDQPDTSDVAN